MILTLKKLRWKNFNSYGEMWTEVDLTRNPITVVIGKNGYGKSTVTDALAFNLFGKAIRQSKKGNLINRRNKKGLMTESYFDVDGKEYLVRRGLKPDIFEIISGDDVLKDKDASDREYQKILENNILKMNFTTFTQSVIVSKTLYTPFMSMKAPQRRSYVENVLRLQIFGVMAKIHKKQNDDLDDEYYDAKNAYDKLVIKYDETLKMIEVTKNMMESNTKDKIESINTQIQSKKDEINKLVTEYKTYEKQLIEVDDSIIKKYNTNNSTLMKLENKKEIVEEELDKLKLSDNKCSMCGSDYSQEHIDSHINEKTETLEKIINAIKTLTETVKSLKIELDQHTEDSKKNTTINSEMNSIKRLMVSHNSEVKKLEVEFLNISDKEDTTAIDKLNETLYNIGIEKNNKEDNYKDLAKKLNYGNLITTMLKDSGIKSTIIDKSIPLINKLINKNLSDFGFFVKFELDSEFNETISVRGFESASYSDFSEGEKLRIDMAILLAWRDIAMMQNAMFCNVLFLDEITDASMDDEGTEIFAQMLTTLKDNNVFIITHKPEKLDNIARSTIVIDKKDGYSYIK